MIPDGQQGAILAWYDNRNEATSRLDIYVQRIGPSAEERWTTNGVPVCTAPGDQYNEALISDGKGGAILAWTDARSSIYSQRVTRNGTVAWTRDGIRLTETNASTPEMASDGQGGAVMVWQDWTNGQGQIRAQRVDPSGNLLWGSSGVGVCTVPGFHTGPKICSDGDAGAFVAWTDRRGPIPDVFVQHLSHSGVALWADQGIAVCDEPSDHRAAALASDGCGRATVIWADSRNRPADYFGLFAQRLDSSGRRLWNAAGVALSDETVSEHLSMNTLHDGDDLVTLWHERRGAYFDSYTQRLDRHGNRLLGPAGVVVADGPGDQIYPRATLDRSHGMIMVWNDIQYGNPMLVSLFAQHTDALGNRAWGTSGVAIASVGGDGEQALASDGRGGAFTAWVECCGKGYSIFVEHITEARSHAACANAMMPSPVPDVDGAMGAGLNKVEDRAEMDVSNPNSSGRAASVVYRLPRQGPVELAIFDLAGRRVLTILSSDQTAGRHVVGWDAASLNPGVYSLRLRAGGEMQSSKVVVVK
jgi:hypothetical protein